MGGDGGVIAAKRDFMQSCGDVFGMKGGMVKTALTRAETAELRSKVCAVSNERLAEPIAADELGYLFNKDKLLSGLLERDLSPAFSHIRGLKDVIDCRMTTNPSFEKEDRPSDAPEPSQFMCPVTLQELNGSHPFLVIRGTGWVIAEKAIKEVGIAGLQEEYGPFTEEDVIKLAPTDEEREDRYKALLAKRQSAKAAKKASKRRNGKGTTASGGGESSEKGVVDRAEEGKRAADSATQHSHSKRQKRAHKDEHSVQTDHASSKLAGAAAEAVKKNKESSAVYASLFGKQEVSNERLFIATAGHRYNLN